MISAGITLGIYLWHLFDAWFFEGNYVELGKASAMEIHSQESLFGSRLRISSGREALSLRLDFLF
jgi:hypothetical protein